MEAGGNGDLRVIGNGSIDGGPAWANTLLQTWYALLRGNTPAVAAATVVMHLASSSATTGLIDAVLSCDGA
jgi:hypothetical protein